MIPEPMLMTSQACGHLQRRRSSFCGKASSRSCKRWPSKALASCRCFGSRWAPRPTSRSEKVERSNMLRFVREPAELVKKLSFGTSYLWLPRLVPELAPPRDNREKGSSKRGKSYFRSIFSLFPWQAQSRGQSANLGSSFFYFLFCFSWAGGPEPIFTRTALNFGGIDQPLQLQNWASLNLGTISLPMDTS